MANFTRRQLHQLVWQAPLSRLGKQYGIRPQLIAEQCDRFDIARPNSGYWTQRACGTDTPRPPLDSSRYADDHPVTLAERPAADTMLPEIPVPQRLIKPLPAIQRARSVYRPPSMAYDVMLWLPRQETDAAALSVSKGSFSRALRLLNALLKACHQRGWRTATRWDNRTYLNTVTIEAQTLGFRLRERLSQVERPLSTDETHALERGGWVWHRKINAPTGILQFTLEAWIPELPRQWADTKTQPLEQQLGAVIVGMARAAEMLRARAQAAAKAEAQRQHRHHVQQQLQAQQTAWTQRADVLPALVSAWQQTEQHRAFLTHVRRQWLARGPLSAAQLAWLQWANTVMDARDPLSQLSTEALHPWEDTHPLTQWLRSETAAGNAEEPIILSSLPFSVEQLEAYLADRA
ncbi:MAG: hypothetical protein OQK12_17765 [Motiliproteus sp.]|nr:hypothetical protein [Motiliproteus sp.]MCW9053525.1 hypothetical protein [Motiliproteus sp.]